MTQTPKFTAKQGQYLTFIYYYMKLNGRAPAEADMQKYFGVSAPTVNQMVRRLGEAGLIDRMPGKARSISLLVERDQLPELD